MNCARASLIAAVGLVFSAEVVSAQDSFRYRTYVLESSRAWSSRSGRTRPRR
jgi:hypothetical protein